jgi:hypothetical protein
MAPTMSITTATKDITRDVKQPAYSSSNRWLTAVLSHRVHARAHTHTHTLIMDTQPAHDRSCMIYWILSILCFLYSLGAPHLLACIYFCSPLPLPLSIRSSVVSASPVRSHLIPQSQTPSATYVRIMYLCSYPERRIGRPTRSFARCRTIDYLYSSVCF